MMLKRSYSIMQDNSEENKLEWKKIRNNDFISTLNSKTNQKIYVKKMMGSRTSHDDVTLFLFHDFGSYHGRFSKFISWIQERHSNIHFVLMDFEGHGLSSGSRGIIPRLEDLAEDVDSLINCFSKTNPEEKWYFCGQGLGALVILELLKSKDYTHPKIDGMILSNFALTLDSKLFEFDKKWLGGLLLKTDFLNHARGFDHFKPAELLTQTESINKWFNDPLTLKSYSLQSASIINQKCATLFHDSYFIDKKSLVLTSDSKLTAEATTRFFLKGFKKELIEKKHYPVFKHDLYNELDNEIIFEDIAHWMVK